MTSSSQLPERFDKYSILGHLATGGMAEVYLARQGGLQGFEKLVVIKRVRPELMRHREVTQSFLDEAKLVATLQHPNIAQVYEVGLVDGSYFFAMEYVHGADLRHVMQRAVELNHRVTLGDAIFVMIQVCIAIHYAHEKCGNDGEPLHIVHRDITPSNVLLSLDGAIKVCDFGIAKAKNRTTETTRGVLKGKYSYMSPEQCRGKPVDRRSDVFALGILLYELTTLTKLFTGDSEFELLRTIVEGEYQPPSKRVPHYPPELEKIVMRCLAKDPAQRFQSAQALQLALENFVRELRLQQSPVAIAKLMKDLFDERLEPWLKAQREGKQLADFLVDTAVRRVGNLPVFAPIGTSEEELQQFGSDTDLDRDTEPVLDPLRAGLEVKSGTDLEKVRTLPRAPQPRLARASVPQPLGPEPRPAPPSPLWLAGAGLAALAVAGALVAGHLLDASARDRDTNALAGDVERVSSALDTAARSSHGRAASIAATPVLRAALATDAATLRDLADKEALVVPGPGEEIEIFQRTAAGVSSLLRVPHDAAPLPVKPGTHLVQRDGTTIAIATVDIPRTNNTPGGEVVVATRVELEATRQQLAPRYVAARVVGPELDVALVPAGDRSGGPPATLPIVSSADGGLSNLSLSLVPPRAAAAASWPRPLAWLAASIAVLLAAIYAGLWLRKQPQ